MSWNVLQPLTTYCVVIFVGERRTFSTILDSIKMSWKLLYLLTTYSFSSIQFIWKSFWIPYSKKICCETRLIIRRHANGWYGWLNSLSDRFYDSNFKTRMSWKIVAPLTTFCDECWFWSILKIIFFRFHIKQILRFQLRNKYVVKIDCCSDDIVISQPPFKHQNKNKLKNTKKCRENQHFCWRHIDHISWNLLLRTKTYLYIHNNFVCTN